MIDPDDIDAVVFDIGGVFTLRSPELFGAALRDAGFDVTTDVGVYHRAHYHAVRALTDAPAGSESDPDFWRYYERAYVGVLGVDDDRAAEAQAALRHLWETGPRPLWRYVLDDNVEAFRRIAARWPVAIVSNNEGTAESQLRQFGICQIGPGPLTTVAAVVDSTIVGVAKPDPAIFRPALDALGVLAARALYVGDTVHADVVGARAAGMPVVQLDPYDLHTDHDHHRARDVAGIAADLGV